jgi:hypothetical protein
MVKVIEYDPARLAIVDTVDRELLIKAIAESLYLAMGQSHGISLKDAYRGKRDETIQRRRTTNASRASSRKGKDRRGKKVRVVDSPPPEECPSLGVDQG